MTTIGLFNGKGGVGKSILSQLLATFAAYRGQSVRLWDFDGQPGTSFFFCRFEEKWLQTHAGRTSNRRALLKREPRKKTILRVLLRPDEGLSDVAIEFPLDVVLDSFPTLARYQASQVDVTGLLDKMLGAYGMTRTKMGTLLIIPNGGTFEDLLVELRTRKSADPSFKTYAFLASVFAALKARGEVADVDILDIAGERGPVAEMAAYVTDIAVLPFQATLSSLDALTETIEDLLRVQALRSSPIQIVPVLNMVKPGLNREITEWVDAEVAPVLAGYGITRSPILIPESVNIGERANRAGTPALLYDPLDGACQSAFQLYQTLLP